MGVFDIMKNRQNWASELLVYLPTKENAEYVFRIRRIAQPEMRAVSALASDGDDMNYVKLGNALAGRIKREIIGVHKPDNLAASIQDWKDIVEMFYEAADDVLYPGLGIAYRQAMRVDEMKAAENPTTSAKDSETHSSPA